MAILLIHTQLAWSHNSPVSQYQYLYPTACVIIYPNFTPSHAVYLSEVQRHQKALSTGGLHELLKNMWHRFTELKESTNSC